MGLKAMTLENHFTKDFTIQLQKKSTKELVFIKDDYRVNTNQEGTRYLLETLEPTAQDSFSNWIFLILFYSKKKAFRFMFGKGKRSIIIQEQSSPKTTI